MNLLDETFQKKEEQKGKTARTMVLIAIIIVVLIICAIVGYMAYLKSNTIRATIDGQAKSELKSILIVEKEDGTTTTLDENPKVEDTDTIYIPIKRIAKDLGYESYSGEYSDKSETDSKCYVQCENEVANFELGSNKIYKLDLTKNLANNYEYVYSKKPVKSFGGKLYATVEAVEKAFNISFTYNQNDKSLTIYTLPYLVQAYSTYALDNGYKKINETFANQKAILKGLIVVEKSEKILGVIDTDGNSVLEPKYEEIEYLPNVGNGEDFLVASNNKVGIISSKRETKIDILYDSIELLDIDAGLYLAKRDGKYGVLDVRGKTVIHIENDQIGIDTTKFTENGIKNKYIIAENLIPAQKDKLWGLYDKKGNLVVDYEYDSLGYIANTSGKARNLLVIPDYNVIVACKDKKYILISSNGRKLFDGVIADNIYMEIDGGERTYTIDANGEKIDAIGYLDGIGISKDNKSNSTQTQPNTSTQTPQQTEETKNSSLEGQTNSGQENQNNQGTQEGQENQDNQGNQEGQGNQGSQEGQESQNNQGAQEGQPEE